MILCEGFDCTKSADVYVDYHNDDGRRHIRLHFCNDCVGDNGGRVAGILADSREVYPLWTVEIKAESDNA